MQASPILIHVPHASTYIPLREMKYFITKDIYGEILRMTYLYTEELFDCGQDMIIFPVPLKHKDSGVEFSKSEIRGII